MCQNKNNFDYFKPFNNHTAELYSNLQTVQYDTIEIRIFEQDLFQIRRYFYRYIILNELIIYILDH